jgi:hypothetical protein
MIVLAASGRWSGAWWRGLSYYQRRKSNDTIILLLNCEAVYRSRLQADWHDS